MGVYDPDAPDAAERLLSLRHVLAAGVPVERLADRPHPHDHRDALVEHRVLGDTERLSLRQVSQDLGVDLDQIVEILTAGGLPVPGPDERVYTEREKHALELFLPASDMFGEEPALRFTRVLGQSMARIAEAAVALFSLHVEDPLVAGGGGQGDLTRAADEAVQALSMIPDLFFALFPRHALNATRRLSAAHEPQSTHDRLRMAVGFADLVGSTAWSQHLGARELATALGEFEALAHRALRDTTRLVKTIGDEIMIAANQTAEAVRTALDLADSVAAHPDLPELRVGLTTGLVAAIDGDFYGPEVNLASRLVHVAEPGQVVGSRAVADTIAGATDLRARPVGRHQLAGFEDPAEVFELTWADSSKSASR